MQNLFPLILSLRFFFLAESPKQELLDQKSCSLNKIVLRKEHSFPQTLARSALFQRSGDVFATGR